MAGEALSHVQGESLKGSAAVYWRFVNSPVTSAMLVTASPQGDKGRFLNVLQIFQTQTEATIGECHQYGK
jgi:hypothetical protein